MVASERELLARLWLGTAIIPDQCVDTINVDRSVHGLYTQLLPVANVPFVRVWVGVGILG